MKLPRQPFQTDRLAARLAMADDPAVRLAWTTEQRRKVAGFALHGSPAGPQDRQAVTLPREAHVLTVAPTGAGKTLSCTVPFLLQYPGPVFIVDPKGENALVTARHRRAMGHDVHVVDPFGVTGLPASSLNPMALVDLRFADAADDARSLAELMLPARYDTRDVFWRNRGLYAVANVIRHVAETYPAPQRTLMTVRDLLFEVSKRVRRGNAEGTIREAQSPVGPRTSLRQVEALMDIGSAETAGGILHYALEAVGIVGGPLIEASLARSSFSIGSITEARPLTVYFVLPPHTLASHAPLLRIWLTMVFHAVQRRRTAPRLPTMLLIDEAAQLGHFPPLLTAITLMRGYGLQTWSFFQDVGQLRQLYPDDWRTIVNNCRVVQCFGPTSPRAWQDMCDLLGFTGPSSDELDPSDMLCQHDGTALLVRRMDYRSEPEFQGRFDPNPYHASHKGRLARHRPKSLAAVKPPSRPYAFRDTESPGFAQVHRAILGLWEGDVPA